MILDRRLSLKKDSNNLRPLREVINAHGLKAKKSLGQNFLLDLNLTFKIARAAGDVKDKNIIEIGPGPGGLTRGLLNTEAKHVYSIEKDTRCIDALQELIEAYPDRFTLLSADALKTNITDICPAPRTIAANLPYNISTPLLISWLKQIDEIDSMTLMFQKEVAERITAKPRTKAYGRISIISQWLCKVNKAFDIPPSAFTPPPKITSSVVHFKPIANRKDNADFKSMEKITAAAFGQRRKTLRQSLKTLGIDAEILLEKGEVSPKARAEELDIQAFVRLAEELKKFKNDT